MEEVSCVLQQPPEATWQSCSGRGTTAAGGMRPHAQPQPEGATWQSCSGRYRMAASGLRTPAPRLLLEATWQC